MLYLLYSLILLETLNYETSAYKVLRALGARLARAPHRKVIGGAPGIFQQKHIRVLKPLYVLVS
ncbi:MAG: hypothetical protein A3C04_03255 [Candidatus Wildermuthbacteria bacterium RIFCSPHIGHO2_02_FULL_45_25]|uniref:Uncharacterized protein n=1 Tax=Candidatus Wildermuthbacteria bacterium RIFCSPHIGHO2_02_FULL_45_25 TaxID=1802450 RepID=A0A1G2R1V3_9BACT|nr:MAG: hypothetical protein A3C04_03255 [Candidatus Wildermuthbacteria bacterium RIFCSPHIGHO2_02_FULL_45_25]